MSQECQNDCVPPLVFPKRPYNRPGLERIGYRIGVWADFREAMFRQINLHPALGKWTHRQSDDPGVALIEGAAILGDILTFYQEHYANEAFLRTARWRESIADLVRLLGYRLSPGVGGRATFAFEVKGERAISIPAGLPLKAELEDLEDPVDFEVETDTLAYPHLSRFHLYRPRIYANTLSANTSRLELASVGGHHDEERLQAVNLKEGDRLMLMPGTEMWDVGGTPYVAQKDPETVVLAKVEHRLGRTILEIEGKLAANWTMPVACYKLGRTFRHFGHSAPVNLTVTTTVSGQTTTSVSDTRFHRYLYYDPSTYGADPKYYSSLSKLEMPFDQEITDLSVGAPLICQGKVKFTGRPSPVPFVVVKTITGIQLATLQWGNVNGASTVAILNSQLIPNFVIDSEIGDIRDLRFHEVIGPVLTLKKPAHFPADNLPANSVAFFGTQGNARVLVGRRLLFQHESGETTERICTNSDFPLSSGRDSVHRWMWPLTFNQPLAPFLEKDFDETQPKVTVFGNLADADQGKTEREAVLGNGDHRLGFQTFQLPKNPLTYHNTAAATPPEVPELTVRVNGHAWKRVNSFFGHGPNEEIYLVREDAKGNSHVQFGDGETGARLPSGLKNITVAYRTGTGAHGALKEGSKAQTGKRVDGLEKVQLPGIVSGGAEPETGDKAREVAPSKIQSLGRLVSLRDFETETLGIPGVVKANAGWRLHQNVPSVKLTVLLEAGRESEFDAVRQIIADYEHCRGPGRFPVIVVQAHLRYIFLDVLFAFDSTLKREVVDAGLRDALGLADTEGKGGLFSLKSRRIGDKEYATRIAGVLQEVPGIRWCKVTALGAMAVGNDPNALSLPAAPKPLHAVVPCGTEELLQLHSAHLQLIPAPPEPTDECES